MAGLDAMFQMDAMYRSPQERAVACLDIPGYLEEVRAEEKPDLDPMEDPGEPTAPYDLTLQTRLARIKSGRRWEEHQDEMPLAKRLKTIRFYRGLAAEFEYKNMRELAFDVLERTSLEERKRLHVKGAPSFQEILIWATREAKSMDLEQKEKWLDFCHGRLPRGQMENNED